MSCLVEEDEELASWRPMGINTVAMPRRTPRSTDQDLRRTIGWLQIVPNVTPMTAVMT